MVIMTDRPTSALARYVMILLAVPPGQHATMMMPAAKGVEMPGICAMRKPSVGMIVYCRTAPSVTRPGFFNTLVMSRTVSVKPMHSIVAASIDVM